MYRENVPCKINLKEKGEVLTMGTRLATGLSKAKESAVAAKEAVMMAKEKLEGGRVDLSMVYASTEYDYRKVVDTVRKTTNNAPLIGASSAGEFTEERVERKSVAVGLMACLV